MLSILRMQLLTYVCSFPYMAWATIHYAVEDEVANKVESRSLIANFYLLATSYVTAVLLLPKVAINMLYKVINKVPSMICV